MRQFIVARLFEPTSQLIVILSLCWARPARPLLRSCGHTRTRLRTSTRLHRVPFDEVMIKTQAKFLFYSETLSVGLVSSWCARVFQLESTEVEFRRIRTPVEEFNTD